MADFNDLLGEIDDTEESIPRRQNSNDDDDPEEEEMYTPNDDDNDVGDNLNISSNTAQIPFALAEAEAIRKKQLESKNEADDAESFNNNDDDYNFQGRDGDEEGEMFGPDDDYEHLKHLWIQELNCTELLSYDQQTIPELIEMLDGQEDTIDELQAQAKSKEGNVDPHLASLAASICKMDADRLRFLLTDLTRIRLQKIERYALHVREEVDRLSKDERTFLRQYGELFEKHMRQSVTDRLPKEAWKSLDEPEMIDRPDLDSYVFCEVREPVEIDNLKGFFVDREFGEEDDYEDNRITHHGIGETLFVRYGVIQDLVYEGKVRLLM